MPHVVTSDGVRLAYEEAGAGTPLVFVHEYGNDARTWEPQIRFFAQRYRCVAYNARGFPPSDVPTRPDAYSQDRAVEDLADVIRRLQLAPAHVVGLAMGSFATLFHSLKHPGHCRSQVVAGCGYGADLDRLAEHEAGCERVASLYEREGSAKAAEVLASGPARRQLREKDEKTWREFRDRMAEHSAVGAALTQRGVLMKRPSIYSVKDDLARLQTPTLLLAGDEDDPLIEPNIFLKRTLPAAALVLMPRSGHTLNLEDPQLFNSLVFDFLTKVDAGRWAPRHPASRFGPPS